jgi:hypothetical protein
MGGEGDTHGSEQKKENPGRPALGAALHFGSYRLMSTGLVDLQSQFVQRVNSHQSYFIDVLGVARLP